MNLPINIIKLLMNSMNLHRILLIFLWILWIRLWILWIFLWLLWIYLWYYESTYDEYESTYGYYESNHEYFESTYEYYDSTYEYYNVKYFHSKQITYPSITDFIWFLYEKISLFSGLNWKILTWCIIKIFEKCWLNNKINILHYSGSIPWRVIQKKFNFEIIRWFF